MPLANCLSILSSQRARFSFIDLSNVSLISPSFISTLIFMISFLILTLRFFFFFLVALDVSFGCLFDGFIVS